ncbi:conserved hypothetical protein [uncultured delta proteobacterium]|uniref:UPF0033 domain-containing protein n=1 Tax=uncultured delta proteobacterium TaxID=34034 RepID=A0A212K9R1_9DELT|nr:conserved hypothetical protein [uncultured delta proteobacterium]
MVILDCLGEICPVPVMRLQKALKDNAGYENILLITDHSCVPKSIGEFCRAKKLGYVADEVINGVWELHITPRKQ